MKLSETIFAVAVCVLGLIPSLTAQGPDSASKSVTVVARGVGSSVSDATKDACRAAVEQALGGVVSAESRLENEVLFERVVIATAGSLERFEVVEEVAEQDWVRVKIRAEVSRNLLWSKAAEFREVVASADGASIAAKARSKIEGRAAAAALVAEQLRGWPAKLLRATVEGEPCYVKADEKTVVVGARVRLSVDPKQWSVMHDALIAAIRAVSQSESVGRDFRRSERPAAFGEADQVFRSGTRTPEFLQVAQFSDPELFVGDFDLPPFYDTESLKRYCGLVPDLDAGWRVLLVGRRPDRAGGDSFLVPSNVIDALINSAWEPICHIEIALEDESGSVLGAGKIFPDVSILKTEGDQQVLVAEQVHRYGPVVKGEDGRWWIGGQEARGGPREFSQPYRKSVTVIDPALAFGLNNYRSLAVHLSGSGFLIPVAIEVRAAEVGRIRQVRARLITNSD